MLMQLRQRRDTFDCLLLTQPMAYRVNDEVACRQRGKMRTECTYKRHKDVIRSHSLGDLRTADPIVAAAFRGTMPTATATFRTPNASRYIQQLCKHFAVKVSAEWTETAGRADLPGGSLTLRAADGKLRIAIEGTEPKGVVQARYVLEDHLVRFAFREGLIGLSWSFGTSPTAAGEDPSTYEFATG
jgi:uncharacterized protein